MIGSIAATLGGPRQALAQQQMAPSRAGTVLAIENNTLYLKTFQGPLTAILGNGGQVWKRSISYDLSPVQIGDRVVVRGGLDFSGTFVATDVWVNIGGFYGRIVSVTANQYEVLVTRGNRQWIRKAVVDSNTLGQGNELLSSSDLAVGRFVQTVGIKMADGTLLASRVFGSVSAKDLPSGTVLVGVNGKRLLMK